MTVSSLPPQSAIVAPVTAANKTEPVQADNSQEPSSFQQVLNSQINKDAAEAAPAAQAKGKAKPTRAEEAQAAKSPTAAAGQPEVTAEQAAELADAMLKAAAGTAKAEAEPSSAADEQEDATIKGEDVLPVALLPDQVVQQSLALPGLASLTKTEAVSTEQSHAAAEGAAAIGTVAAPIAAAKPSGQPVSGQPIVQGQPIMQNQAPTALPHADAKSAQQQADEPAAATASAAANNSQLIAAKEEDAASPDFAKLLAARESQPMVAAYQTQTQIQTMLPLTAGQIAAANMTSVEQPLGTKGWDQAVSQKVVWMVGAKEQSATLTLNPPDLGPLQVVIHVHNDQADATFISQNPEVRQALENSISTLRSMMSDSGIQLGDANISANSQSQQGFQQAEKERSAAGSRTANAQAREEAVIAPAVRSYSRAGLVDTFA
ncbi:MAG TPA: flagellar hook-length control protein FliK [Methylophilaceae bacterium]|nr:flagellar hook-length control protein FliK [Methylophilaceae bacterium]